MLREEESESLIEEVESFMGIDVEVDLRKALVGGVLAALVALAGSVSVGRLSGAEGLVLLESMIPTIRFLCSSVMTASATILALMLTLLGLSHRTRTRMKTSHYRRVKQIALVDTATFVLATILLLSLNIPLQQEGIPGTWFNTIYYIVIALSSLLGGCLITVMLMLYGAVRDMIYVVGLGVVEHPIVSEDELDEDE